MRRLLLAFVLLAGCGVGDDDERPGTPQVEETAEMGLLRLVPSLA